MRPTGSHRLLTLLGAVVADLKHADEQEGGFGVGGGGRPETRGPAMGGGEIGGGEIGGGGGGGGALGLQIMGEAAL